MSEKKDDIRFPKSVEMECKGQGWPCRHGGWIHPFAALDPRLPDGPMVCDDCLSGKNDRPVFAIFRTDADGIEKPAGHWGQNEGDLRAEMAHLDENERYRGVPVTPKRVGPWVGPPDVDHPQPQPN